MWQQQCVKGAAMLVRECTPASLRSVAQFCKGNPTQSVDAIGIPRQARNMSMAHENEIKHKKKECSKPGLQ